MIFQQYRGHRRLIGYLMSMDAMKAALTAGAGFLASIADTKAVLTAGAESMTSKANIKVRLKSDEFEKGAIMKVKKIKALFLVR
jgi:hypothetical protein